MPQDNYETLEDVKIIFRNFKGREGPYNKEGDRSFAALLTPEQATYFQREGWNVKTTKEREVDDEMLGGEPYLPVAVHYSDRGRPPTVVMIGSRGRTNLDIDTIELLDFADIVNVDLKVRPFDWGPINGKYGRKAYLQAIYVTVNEDDLELKYADVPVAGSTGRRRDEEDD